jgi:ACT domain-containing protein
MQFYPGPFGVDVMHLIKKNPDKPDKEIIKMSGLSKGTFYKYKKVLQNKGLI